MFREFVGSLMWVGILFIHTSANAAVHMADQSLSVNVSKVALGEVLEDISRDGRLTVIVLEDVSIQQILISEVFQNLPLEAGLERLLQGLNYAFVRDPFTGRIKTLYLVSQRKTISSPPSLFGTTRQNQNALVQDPQRPTQNPGAPPPSEEKIPEPVPPHEMPEFEDFFNSLDSVPELPALP